MFEKNNLQIPIVIYALCFFLPIWVLFHGFNELLIRELSVIEPEKVIVYNGTLGLGSDIDLSEWQLVIEVDAKNSTVTERVYTAGAGVLRQRNFHVIDDHSIKMLEVERLAVAYKLRTGEEMSDIDRHKIYKNASGMVLKNDYSRIRVVKKKEYRSFFDEAYYFLVETLDHGDALITAFVILGMILIIMLIDAVFYVKIEVESFFHRELFDKHKAKTRIVLNVLKYLGYGLPTVGVLNELLNLI